MTLTQFMQQLDQEATFQAQVIDLAKRYRWLAYHTRDSRRSEPGFPDVVLVKDRVIFAELKSAKGTMSPAQIVWRDALRAAGAEFYEWRPSDLQQIVNILSGRQR